MMYKEGCNKAALFIFRPRVIVMRENADEVADKSGGR
jgi:hypothetical protein